jgi:hypothetical protein
MARGPSGRIVVEVDPAVKARLYEVLAKDEFTFKDWLLRQIEGYVEEATQPRLFQPPGSRTSGRPATSGEP